MSHWLTRRLWRALGRRYTRVVLYAYFQVAHLITLAGVGLFALYADLDGGQLGRIIAVSQGLVFLENLASIWFVGRLLRPAEPWLRGQRDPGTAAQAWRALVSLPVDYLTYRPGVPVFFSVVPIAVYIWLEVGGGWLALPVLMAGVRGLGERERLREAFGAFVDPVLADRVLEEGTTLAGEEVDVTIMFLDIRSFTAFAERADPAQVVGKATASPRRVWPARPRGCARSDRACAGDRNAGRELRRSRRVRRAHAGRVRCASPLPAERARSR